MYDMPNVCGKLFKKIKIIIKKSKKIYKKSGLKGMEQKYRRTDGQLDKNNGEFIKNEQFLLDFPKEFRF